MHILRCIGMSIASITSDTREIDMDTLDPADRKMCPRFTRRDGRWLVVIPKEYAARTGEYVQVLRTNGVVRIVQLQDQVLYRPNNMKRGTKDVFLCKDVTDMNTPYRCHTLLLDGTGRCHSDVCLLK